MNEPIYAAVLVALMLVALVLPWVRHLLARMFGCLSDACVGGGCGCASAAVAVAAVHMALCVFRRLGVDGAAWDGTGRVAI